MEKQAVRPRSSQSHFTAETYGTRVQLLERGLGVHVHSREPAAKAGMGVIPSHHHFRPPSLLEHLEHIGLENWVDSLNTHSSSMLHGQPTERRKTREKRVGGWVRRAAESSRGNKENRWN